MPSKVRFYNRLSFKIGLILLLIIIIGIGITMTFYLTAQYRVIINTHVEGVREKSEILHISVKNNMLAGEAPIAVDLFEDFSRSDFISDVKLFRSDGTPAFSDNVTLDLVNKVLGMEQFAPKEVFIQQENETSDEFNEAVSGVKDVLIQSLRGSDKKITVYTPLINQPKCAACHGLDHVIRGVVCVSTPMDEAYQATIDNMVISGSMGLGVIFFLSVTIILYLNSSVISKILKIGTVAEGVGEGNFKQKLNFKSSDEIGRLAVQMNTMIDGLNERFKLSKFVSKSTLEHVKGADDISLGGERRNITVLFTDVRNFTSYSENRDPEEVLTTLNSVMHLQAEIIQKYFGDIDKYVGDEIMAVFDGEDMERRACKAALEIRDLLQQKNENNELDVTVGIGINSGEVVMGNMGSLDRVDRTIIGDTVNLGARLCSIAGKNTIVISENVYNSIGEISDVNTHKPISVKGKSDPVMIYTLRKMQF
jgi:adenylate cyclase